MTIRIENIVNAMTVGALAGLAFGVLSWQFFAALITWSVLSALASAWDESKC